MMSSAFFKAALLGSKAYSLAPTSALSLIGSTGKLAYTEARASDKQLTVKNEEAVLTGEWTCSWCDGKLRDVSFSFGTEKLETLLSSCPHATNKFQY